jgi:hypothetical protein
MNFPRYFVFGKCGLPIESFIRLADVDRSIMITPGIGQVSTDRTFPLERCVEFTQMGVMSECEPAQIATSLALWRRLFNAAKRMVYGHADHH